MLLISQDWNHSLGRCSFSACCIRYDSKIPQVNYDFLRITNSRHFCNQTMSSYTDTLISQASVNIANVLVKVETARFATTVTLVIGILAVEFIKTLVSV